VEFIQPKSFIEVAYILNNCKFCIGNQTFYFSLAEALKVPRLLELYKVLPDVIPKGKMAMEFVDNQTFQDDFNFFKESLI
jgi:ADP-heptose:LPS heptosyltransferase